MPQNTNTATDKLPQTSVKKRRLSQSSAPEAISPSPMASLEGLPVELKVTILASLQDVPTLEALVKSSPSFHQSYFGQRQLILSAVLSTELTPNVLLEARYVFQAGKIQRGESEESWISDVKSFPDDYKAQLRGTSNERASEPSPLWKVTDLETLLSIVKLQSSIRDVSKDFHRSTLSIHPTSGQDLEFQELSLNERRRIYRACYRFEIFSYLFANLIWSPLYTLDWSPEIGYQAGILFFSEFERWEVEEIYCIREYIYRAYDKIFRENEDELFKFFFREEERDRPDGMPQTESDVLARMRPKSKFCNRMSLSIIR